MIILSNHKPKVNKHTPPPHTLLSQRHSSNNSHILLASVNRALPAQDMPSPKQPSQPTASQPVASQATANPQPSRRPRATNSRASQEVVVTTKVSLVVVVVVVDIKVVVVVVDSMVKISHKVVINNRVREATAAIANHKSSSQVVVVVVDTNKVVDINKAGSTSDLEGLGHKVVVVVGADTDPLLRVGRVVAEVDITEVGMMAAVEAVTEDVAVAMVDLGDGGGGFGSRDSDNGYNKGGGEMEVQHDTVFISGMQPNAVDEGKIKEHFGQIGIIKLDKRTQKDRIWIYRNKQTHEPTGEATVTYDDPHTATSAIEWFNGKPFAGGTIKVELAQRPANRGGGRGGRGGGRGFDRGGRGRGGMDRGGRGGGGRGGGRGGPGGGGGSHRDGDWECSTAHTRAIHPRAKHAGQADCGNKNFGWRQNCNRCSTPKEGGGGGGQDMGGGMRGGRGGGFRGRGGDRGGPGDRGGRGGFGGDRGGRGGFGGGRGGGFRGGRGGPGGPGFKMGGDRMGDRRDRRDRPY
ncbi:RNA-binding protein cabeza-like isoform X42 [Lytechinus variegatus]|uniref:RNA-binding protein cabeza-like isoform X42 n=1 Tax=Lytechinus variegatus TaxID=7654 RepID=UPI001BB1B29C|nr:RNA-binding protein cabeza-like isoform X42 [Lytechinus variegatus]